jgi:thiamine biosynthesis lipoprotein ApbE
MSMTNTTKAQVIVAINSILALVVAFGVNLSEAQTGAITVAVNALLSIWVGLTYKNSPKRTPDA